MYRKFQPDRLFNGYDFLPGPAVLITRPDGTIENCVSPADAGDDIEQIPGILMPGMINAHGHIELSHLKGIIPEHTGLVPFLLSVVSNREAASELKYFAMKEALASMRALGMVGMGDISNGTDSISVKAESDMLFHHFIELTGFVPAAAQQRMQAASDIQKKFLEHFQPERVSLSPHAPYSVSTPLMDAISRETEGKLISLHFQESPEEDGLFLNKSGKFLELFSALGVSLDFFTATHKRSTGHFLPHIRHAQKLLLVHNTCSEQDDLAWQDDYLRSGAITGLYHVFCPGANLYIENKMPPIGQCWKHGCQILLGTDSLASNHTLNLWQEISLVRNACPEIPEQTVLSWVTSQAARAFDMDAYLGRFEKGLKPGIVQVFENRPRRLL